MKINLHIIYSIYLMDPIDFHSREKNTMEVNGVHQLSGYRHSSKYLILC